MKLTPKDFNTKVGQEWYPYDSWEFLGNSTVACIAMVVGYVAFDPAERRKAQHPLFFLLFSTALMIMTARWKRIAEYWPPFAVLFAGFALAAVARRCAELPDTTAAGRTGRIETFSGSRRLVGDQNHVRHARADSHNLSGCCRPRAQRLSLLQSSRGRRRDWPQRITRSLPRGSGVDARPTSRADKSSSILTGTTFRGSTISTRRITTFPDSIRTIFSTRAPSCRDSTIASRSARKKTRDR